LVANIFVKEVKMDVLVDLGTFFVGLGVFNLSVAGLWWVSLQGSSKRN